ncbi:TIGR00266 family protein [Bacillus mexicanus]|uniref:TIGR00266 family protein n=1 Tax=Bacillus mexicanus TaxID=2834415 RepID=UPI003D1DAADA
MNSHEIDFKILGDDMQYVLIALDPQETVISEAGNFFMMDDGIKMETLFGDGSEHQKKGFGSKLLGAGKRLFTGESLFMTSYTNELDGKRIVAFSAPYPGKIIPVDLQEYGGKIICQKDAFLCAAKGVSLGLEFNKKIGAGFFGGEGFILQKLEGDGMTFIHAGGSIVKRELSPGERLIVDTGALVAMTKDISYDIQRIKGVKSVLFSGNGLFNTVLSGPGTVWVQSLPFNKLVNTISNSVAESGNPIGGAIEGFLES